MYVALAATGSCRAFAHPLAAPEVGPSHTQEFIFHVVDGRLALEETVWLDELIVTACTVERLPAPSLSARRLR
mgnify:CR=1 FL=1